jgi:hypothetical protein
MHRDDSDIRWNPRVPQARIRRLYETDARGNGSRTAQSTATSSVDVAARAEPRDIGAGNSGM